MFHPEERWSFQQRCGVMNTKEQLSALGFKPVETAPENKLVEVAHVNALDEILMGRLHSDGWELDGGFVVDGEDVEPTHWRVKVIHD